jgi:hypothetical protein
MHKIDNPPVLQFPGLVLNHKLPADSVDLPPFRRRHPLDPAQRFSKNLDAYCLESPLP